MTKEKKDDKTTAEKAWEQYSQVIKDMFIRGWTGDAIPEKFLKYESIVKFHWEGRKLRLCYDMKHNPVMVEPYDLERMENAGILPRIVLPEGSEEKIDKVIEDAYNKIKEYSQIKSYETLSDYCSIKKYYVIAKSGSYGHFAEEDAVWLFYNKGIWYDEIFPEMLFSEEDLDVLENEILPKAQKSTSDKDVHIYKVPVVIGEM